MAIKTISLINSNRAPSQLINVTQKPSEDSTVNKDNDNNQIEMIF